jgi:hypothetical protein
MDETNEKYPRDESGLWRGEDSTGAWRGVSRGVEDGPAGRPPLKRPLGPFRTGPPAGRRRVQHGGP